MSITALVGAQWGSEGKGVIAAKMAHRFDVAVRTGGPNAGHSFYHEDTLYKMRSVPCAWINPDCSLVIGAGAVVDPAILSAELDALPKRYVYVDPGAVVVLPEYHKIESESIRTAIGSTAEGVGQARVAKIERMGDAVLAGDFTEWHDNVIVMDTVQYMAPMLHESKRIMLEGTQGVGLSLNHGTQYPFVTSADCTAARLVSDAGLPARFLDHTYLVARTFPIRVAGNSGPMGEEISWDDLPVEAPERTTVTNKVRRVANWNDDVFARSVALNAPCGVFLTFMDYIDPDIAGVTDRRAISNKAWEFIEMVESTHDVPVIGIGTGGPRWSVVPLRTCQCGEWWV